MHSAANSLHRAADNARGVMLRLTALQKKKRRGEEKEIWSKRGQNPIQFGFGGRASAKLEKELDANKHAGADSCSIGLRFDLDTLRGIWL